LSPAWLEGDEVYYWGLQIQGEEIRWLDNRQEIFEIGAIIKLFTATLLAQKALKGSLVRHNPLRKYLDQPTRWTDYDEPVRSLLIDPIQDAGATLKIFQFSLQSHRFGPTINGGGTKQ